MAAYLGYTLRMKTLFRGSPVMAHETHTRRRSSYKDLNFLLFRLEKSYHTPKISMFWRFDPNMYENIV